EDTMFTNILFATTASSNCKIAAKAAFEFAHKYGSSLTLFHVCAEPSRGAGQLMKSYASGDEVIASQEFLEAESERIRRSHVPLSGGIPMPPVDVVVGIPSVEILRKARKMAADCIIMGNHTRPDDPSAKQFRGIIGTTLQRVTRRARCPVLIISQGCKPEVDPKGPIVFGADFSDGSLAAFQFVQKQAQDNGAKIYLVHAVEEACDLGEMEDRIFQTYLSDVQPALDCEIEVRQGVAHVELVNFSREVDGNFMVLGPRAQTFETRKDLFSSTVEEVVLRSDCPVVSVNRTEML
ncbi:MAG: universal stress protein, partial [Desulfovibrionales bacterium]|nr:universal stress protein [Desulfovibrionales bacterium]